MATVMVVDDSAVTQKLLSYKLQHSGHTVLLADDGEMALKQLDEAQGAVDLVILDIAMPTMDGLTLLRILRADDRFRALPIVMLTASGRDADRVTAKVEGASAFLTKPVSSWELTETVNDVLAKRSPGREVKSGESPPC